MISKNQKKDILESMQQKFVNANSLAFTEYCGLTVAQLTDLRKKLREVDAEFKVYKNTLTKIALKDVEGSENLIDHMKGSTAVTIANNDPAAPFKVLNEFIKDKTNKHLKFKVGLLEGMIVDEAKLSFIASIPTREVLLAQVAAGFNAPITGLVQCLAGTLRNLVNVLDAVKKQKEEN